MDTRSKMKSYTQGPPAPGDSAGRRPVRRWGLLWAGIGILAFLAAGFFLTTTLIFRTAYTEPKQEAARSLLTALFESEMSYVARHRCYTSDPSALGLSELKAPHHYEWAIVHADCASFLARAWANLDDDPNLDIWEITDDDAFTPLHVFDDQKDIGYRIDPRSTAPWRPTDGYFKPPVSER